MAMMMMMVEMILCLVPSRSISLRLNGAMSVVEPAHFIIIINKSTISDVFHTDGTDLADGDGAPLGG